ncbi:MAG: polysaccharide deacetylase family protein [Ktedonobacteraceae bacterium]|nr:polysaccharide deacetylase family protein [Ktedonobacteraceae bacterium]
MRKYILICIAALFYYSGLVGVARWWTRRSGRFLIILNYHRATGGDLRRHLLYLRKYYHILHVEEAIDDLYKLRQHELHVRDRRTPLVLTFDDGYRDNHTHAYPLARELQVPITIYLVPGYVDSGKSFWWLDSQRMLRNAPVREVHFEESVYKLDQPDQRAALSRLIDTHICHATSVAEREAFLLSMREALALPSSFSDEEDVFTLPLTWQQIQEMQESGWVSFGAHTMNHPVLAYLSDSVELQREIAECQMLLTQRLGHLVRTFAYPIGQAQHIGDAVRKAVQRGGYDYALTTMYGFNSPDSDHYLLKRIEVDVDQHWLVMAAESAGLWGFFSRLRWVPFIRKHFSNAP